MVAVSERTLFSTVLRLDLLVPRIIQVLLDIQNDGIIMIGKVPVNIRPFGTTLDYRPYIRLPCQFVLREGTEVLENMLRMLVECVREMSGHGEETTTEAPVNTLYIECPAKGPASWNRKFGEAGLVDFSEFVQEALLCLHDLEDAVIDPEKCLVGCVFEGSMNKLHL